MNASKKGTEGSEQEGDFHWYCLNFFNMGLYWLFYLLTVKFKQITNSEPQHFPICNDVNNSLAHWLLQDQMKEHKVLCKL